MTRRPGLSLTEVLVALFIVAIGTISILTLFPAGALQMGQALKDDRTTQAASAAEAYMRWCWKRQVIESTPTEAFYTAMSNPGGGAIPVPADSSNNSYPVVVDPMGYYARIGAAGESWVGDGGGGKLTDPYSSQTNLARRSISLITSSSHALRTCTLLDGMTYTPDGVPAATVERDMRYNWLWVLQRLQARGSNDAKKASLTIVVFDKRANLFAPPGSEMVYAPSPRPSNPSLPTPGSTQVVFSAASYPKIQKGGWLLECSVTTLDYQNNVYVPPDAPPDLSAAPPPGWTPPRPGVRNANLYQVVSVTNTGDGYIDFELQSPLLQDTGDATNLTPDKRGFVALNGVADVFVSQVPLAP